MTDDEAYMALVLANAQSELSALERGVHALGATEKGKHGRSINAYAKEVGRDQSIIAREVMAARVVTEVMPRDITLETAERWRALSELHSAPRWLWPALVSRLIAGKWTVEDARREAKKYKDVPEPPEWADAEAIAEALTSGTLAPSDVKAFGSTVAKTEAALKRGLDL